MWNKYTTPVAFLEINDLFIAISRDLHLKSNKTVTKNNYMMLLQKNYKKKKREKKICNKYNRTPNCQLIRTKPSFGQ